MSGSQDRTCILWDLDHLTHVARLPAHRDGVSAVAISDVSVSLLFLNVCILNMSMILHGDMVDSPLRKPGGKDHPRVYRGPRYVGYSLHRQSGAINNLNFGLDFMFCFFIFFSQGGGLVGGVCSDMSIGELGKEVGFGEGSSGFD